MNAAIITDDVVSMLRKRYGKSVQLSKSQVFTFGKTRPVQLTTQNYFGGTKVFYAVPAAMIDPTTVFPKTDLGEYSLFICGSADRVLVIPRNIITAMLEGVRSRRVDIFNEAGSLILQTTKHPKLNVTEYMNAFPTAKGPIAENSEDTESGRPVDRLHVKIQWSLIQLGRGEGCSVWVPISDRNLSYQRAALSANTVDKLPNFGFEENTRRIVQNIDVLWLKQNVIRKAFEIESTTSIYSGLLRLNDLALSQPNNQIDLYIAARESKKSNVYNQLVRPSFQSLLGSCKFLSFEHIEMQAKNLESLELSKDARVSGLIKGELFQVPKHLVYPDHL